MILLLTILKGFLLGWLWTNFEPLQEFITYATKKMSDKYFIIFYLKTALKCFKCASFWITLIMFQDIYAAAGAAFAAYIIECKLKL